MVFNVFDKTKHKFCKPDKFVGLFFYILADIRLVDKGYTAEIKQFGKQVRQMRLDLNITQEDLAASCNIDVRTVQRIERGDSGIGLYIVFALAEAFKVPPSELFRFITMPAK